MSSKIIYVALQQFCQEGEAPRRLLLEAGFEVRQNTMGRRLRREDLVLLLGESDAVLAGIEPYDAQTLSALPRLRLISRCGVGTDSIDLEAAKQRRVAVLTTAEEVVQPVAELTVAMMLGLARNFPRHLRELGAGEWKKHTGHLLSEWTVGLVGYGRIGRAVHRLLSPFSPRIVVCDPLLTGNPPAGVTVCPLAQLLKETDVVSLHAGRPAGEGPLIGREELASMKSGSFLINTARGHLVDEGALEEALRAGRLAGAALDVFQEEPYRGPLIGCPNVILTPHVASLTQASRLAMELACARNVVEFFRGNGRVL